MSFSLRHIYVHFNPSLDAPRDFFFYLIGKLFSRSTAAKDGWNAALLNAEANRVQVSLRFCTQANLNVLKRKDTNKKNTTCLLNASKTSRKKVTLLG